MKADLLQQELFQHIKDLIPTNLSLVDEISSLLRVSQDSAYRRIRGEKSISFAELQLLSTHYRISMDSILKIDSRSSVFYGNWLKPKSFNFRNYLSGLLEHTQRLEQATHKTIFFDAKDFLPFEYLPFPELCAFKYFFWVRTIVNLPAYKDMHFEDHDLGPVLDEISPKLYSAYLKVPSAEFWSDESLNSTLQQLSHYEKLGVFRKPETVEILFDQLTAMLEQVRAQAACGEKLGPGGKKVRGASFDLFYNESYTGHNTTLIEADGLKTVYVNHSVMNMIMTHDAEFCESTRQYFEDAKERCVSLNGPVNDHRDQFFEEMRHKIHSAQLKLA